MRIRKRASLITQTPNFSLQIPPLTTIVEETELHPNGDLTSHRNPSDLHPNRIIKEEKRLELDSSSSVSFPDNTLMVHNNESLKDGEMNMKKMKKKRRAPAAVLMEGSRCSRVNGRGWRCSQQTLIGYSLCEHHLGKGRLKSINTSKIISTNDPKVKKKKELLEVNEKIGMVKARSISSLLDEKPVDDDDHSIHHMITTKNSNIGLV